MKSKDNLDERTAPRPTKCRKEIRRRDEADEIAEGLFDLVRDAADDQKVIDAIAAAIRKAAQGPRKMGVLR